MFLLSAPLKTNSLGNSVCAIYNKEGSNKTIEIDRIFYDNFHFDFNNISSNLPLFKIFKISSSDTFLGGENLVFTKLNNSIVSGDLEDYTNDFVLVKEPIFNVLPSSTIRKFTFDLHHVSSTTAGRFHFAPANLFISKNNKKNFIQDIILRPGEGLAIMVNSGDKFQIYGINVIFWFNTLTDDFVNTYYISKTVCELTTPNYCPFLLFNKTNSNIKFGISNIVFEYYGYAEANPGYVLKVIPIDDIYGLGENVEIVKLDSNNSNLPNEIKIFHNVKVRLKGEKSGIFPGVIYASGVVDRAINPPMFVSDHGEFPYTFGINFRGISYLESILCSSFGTLGPNNLHQVSPSIKMKEIFDSKIKINPGEGIAIMPSLQVISFTSDLLYSEQNKIYIQFSLKDYSPPPQGSGSGEYAFI